MEIVPLVKRVCYRVTSAPGNQHWRQTDRRPGRRLRGPWCCPWCWKSSAWTERMRNKSYFSKVLLATICDFGIILCLSILQFRSSLFCSWVLHLLLLLLGNFLYLYRTSPVLLPFRSNVITLVSSDRVLHGLGEMGISVNDIKHSHHSKEFNHQGETLGADP